MKISNLSVIVASVLERYPETRGNDNVLYVTTCQEMNPIVDDLSFVDAMKNVDILALPPFESVSRCRRKIQSEREDLRADKHTVDARYEKYKEVKEYAVS